MTQSHDNGAGQGAQRNAADATRGMAPDVAPDVTSNPAVDAAADTASGLPLAVYRRVQALRPGQVDALAALLGELPGLRRPLCAAAARQLPPTTVRGAIDLAVARDAAAAPATQSAQVPAMQAAASPAVIAPAPQLTTSPAPATQATAGSQAPLALGPPTPLGAPAGPALHAESKGQLARAIFPGTGTADEAFGHLISANDAVLDRNLADYGSVEDQRVLLDAVIASGTPLFVKRAFHAYWHVQLVMAAGTPKQVPGGTQTTSQDWPAPTLQAIHHQLLALPPGDARTGAWQQLSLSYDSRVAHRGWYNHGNLLLGADQAGATASTHTTGYAVSLAADAKAGGKTLEVSEGARFKAGDTLGLNRTTARRDAVTLTAVAGNTYTLAAPLQHDHAKAAALEPEDGTGRREVNWLDQTIRHEIAHSLDGGAVDAKGFYAKAGWAQYEGANGFDAWVAAMGGEAAWTPNDGKRISGEDRTAIKAAITNALAFRQQGSLFDTYRATPAPGKPARPDATPAHPIMAYEHKAVPVIAAADHCLRMGDEFFRQPTALYAANGKRFSLSFMYGKLQSHDEVAVSDRVSDYALTAPAEFFAEAYTEFYEEAGKPGVPETAYGRLIRNPDWRDWIRDHVHDRGHAPAGTGAAKPAAGAAADAALGAQPGSPKRGQGAGNPGL